ncbi:hypothetical protein [Amycolatopsis sp. NPDC004169]|uniref:hypothetical protein n=1 Tax=Amycolatopsis sp. NPDC004169 TaxID=3154453 RepID=UPI0033BC550D
MVSDCSADDSDYRTLLSPFSLLVVIRTFTELDRVDTLLEALHPESPHIKFVVEPGSKFARGLGAHIEELGHHVLTWAEAQAKRFDVILAAHATPALGDLHGPVVVVPHGAGYHRIVEWSTGSARYPTGLVKSQLTKPSGEVIPSAICMSHEDQIGQLAESAPDAVDRAVVIGDLVFDRIVASRTRREEFRDRFGVLPGQKLVAVTSTWGEYATMRTAKRLVRNLLGQLPMDHYRVLLIMHPNVWSADSQAAIMDQLRDARDSGLVIVPQRTPWEAGLIAADVVLGDHSSLSIYAAAIGCRFLLASDGSKELVPDSPLARLCAQATRLDVDGDLRRQIEDHVGSPPRFSAEEIASTIFQERKRSWANFRSVVRSRAGLPDLVEPPRTTPVDDPKPDFGRRVTSWVATVTSDAGDQPGTGTVRIERYPGVVAEPSLHVDAWRVADYAETNDASRYNCELLLHAHPLSRLDGEKWALNVLQLQPAAHDDTVGAGPPSGARNTGVAAYRHEGGCAVRFVDGTRIEVGTEDVFAAAVALYRLWYDGHPLDRPGNVAYSFRPGEVEKFGYTPAP